MTPREQQVLEMLELLIRQGRAPDEAAETVTVVTGDAALTAAVLKERADIAERVRHLSSAGSLVDPEDEAAPWYQGPTPYDRFWPGLRYVLTNDPGWAPAVPSLDEASTGIVSLLADPHSPQIRTRGLVLGYVQSGKTANFTATIAKAADAGYRMFIVLSGVHNALRRQTQVRLEAQLVGQFPTEWLTLTDEESDFGNPVKALPLVAGTQLRLLAVVKKNVSRLTRLRDWLRKAAETGGLDKCPVLIIDDEADQASPNSAKDPDLDRTKVNERIVELLKLPRVAYVGYTATPFANVLINPADVHDMYPRDFIYALPRPVGYFGADELFGAPLSEEEEQGRSRPDMIRVVPDQEAAAFAVPRNAPFDPEVTPALADALRWFLLASAARRARSGKPAHSSMLVHVTQRVDPQNELMGAIQVHLTGLRGQWRAGDTGPWRAQWDAETAREPAKRHNLAPVSFEELSDQMPPVLSEVRVLADNSQSTERLIYTDDPATVVAVGGNTLSRGLTLEGLVSSFFLRTASTYDSLLQMGRWFGYRPGYADLPRIWTTTGLAEDFKFLSDIERELRSDITRYASQGVKPIELPVRISLHPRMSVTAVNKLHFAVQAEASFSGRRPQTTYFAHTNLNTVKANQDAARALVAAATAAAVEPVDEQPSRTTIRGVPYEAVLTFIDAYRWHPDTEMNSALLARYIRDQQAHGADESWNLVILTRQGDGPTFDLGLPHATTVISRSKLTTSKAGTANIGTLMSRPDRVADLMTAAAAAKLSDDQMRKARDEAGRALLVLYPIDADSRPKQSLQPPGAAPTTQPYRSAMGAAGHLIGVAFSFPTARPGSEPTDKIQVLLPAVDDPGQDEDVEPYTDSEGSRDAVDLDA